MLLRISFKLSTSNLARLVHTNASKLQPGSYLREAGVLWQVQSLKYVSPDATVPSEIAPQTIDANTTLALQLIDISSRVIRPTTMKATDTGMLSLSLSLSFLLFFSQYFLFLTFS